MINTLFNTIINGLDVNAVYTEENINEIFLPLLKKLTVLSEEKGKRILVFVAAPPGAGKSTLCEFLAKLSDNEPSVKPITIIGMDGFHRRQEYLTSTYTYVNDVKTLMVDIKGAPVTFDINKLTDKVIEVAGGKDTFWPLYDRTLHNPVEDAIKVTGDIVLLEGNYLLLKDEGWDKLIDYADYTIKITADPNLLYDRLLERKIKSGADKIKAEEFVKRSDMANVYKCINNSANADLALSIQDDNSYKISQ